MNALDVLCAQLTLDLFAAKNRISGSLVSQHQTAGRDQPRNVTRRIQKQSGATVFSN